MPSAHRIVERVGRFRVFLAAAIVPLIGLFVDSAWGGRVNFAKYQAVSSSGQNGDYGPEFAVDGIVSNFHSFRTNNTTAAQWLEVTFPRAVTIRSAHVYLGLDDDPLKGLPSFKFQYHDGSGWVDVPGSSVTGNTATERSVIFSSASTSDRFRLYTNENGNRYVRELALFPPNLVGGVEQGYPIGTDVRLSLGYKRPAEASSIRLNEYAKRAVDGYVDDLSRWQCNGTSAGDTLEIDLLQAHIVGSAHLYSGSGSPTTTPAQNFVLDHWDGAAWQPIPGAAIASNANPSLVIPFDSPVTTSKIRYRTTSGNYARVRELLLFPPRAGGYPLGQDVEVKSPPTTMWDDFSDSSWRLKSGGPDLRLALVNGNIVYTNNSAGSAVLDWQLLLNHRDGSYRLRHVSTGDCLALSEISTTTGKAVVLEPYTGMPHQDWFLDYVNATQFRLINVYSGLAIAPAAYNWSSGTGMVVVTPSDTAPVQLWQRFYSTHYPKKGLAGYIDSHDQFHAGWSYSWGRASSTVFPFDHTFNPMQWAGGNMAHGDPKGPLDLARNDLQSSPKPAHLMGFNEPDHTDQSNMTPDWAIERWPRLEALEAPLVAPCPANTFGTWLPEWTAKADARGYRRDYTPFHWYAPPNVDTLIADLNSAYTTYGRPIWLTEFSTISWSGSGNWTARDNYNFLSEFMWRAESLSWLKRYSLYQFTEGASGGTDTVGAPRSNTRKSDGTLTPFGQLYAGWDGVTSVLNEKAYHLHNRSTYRRVYNPASIDLVASIDPDTSTAGGQWFLIPGTTADTVRIVSTRDGRRLRFYTGVQVGLAAAGNLQLQTEWRVVANQHGWYFIEHPNTSQRLRINGSGTLVMGPIGSSSDDYKWRFVVPATSEPASPPAAPSPLMAQPSTSEIALSWPAVSGAATYKVNRSATTGGPWQQMAAGLGTTFWTDSGLPTETQYFYTVTATNVLGDSVPSGEASVITLHPYASYASWAQQTLSAFPAQDQTAGADPDMDKHSNLLEFAFLTNPASPSGSPFKTSGASPSAITLEFPWNWRATGLSWQLRHGYALSNTFAWPVVDPGPAIIIRDGDIDRITIKPAMAYPDHGFFILEVLEN